MSGPRPAGSSPAELEPLAAAAWPALERVRYAGWLLRASAGVTQRANSALPGPSDALLEDLLGAVEDFYDARLLPPRIQVSDPQLDAALDVLGWPAVAETEVLTGPLPHGEPGNAVVGDLDDGWFDCWWSVDARGGTAERDIARRLLAGCLEQVGYARLAVDGEVVATARGVVQGRWLGVFAVAVRPSHRRRGAARAVLAALSDWAAGAGATQTYLQVARSNVVARALYADLRPAYAYRYRLRPHNDAGSA